MDRLHLYFGRQVSNVDPIGAAEGKRLGKLNSVVGDSSGQELDREGERRFAGVALRPAHVVKNDARLVVENGGDALRVSDPQVRGLEKVEGECFGRLGNRQRRDRGGLPRIPLINESSERKTSSMAPTFSASFNPSDAPTAAASMTLTDFRSTCTRTCPTRREQEAAEQTDSSLSVSSVASCSND